MTRYAVITWGRGTKNCVQKEMWIRPSHHTITGIDSRSYFLNLLIFSPAERKRRYCPWLIIKHPSVEIIEENLFFPKGPRYWVLYSDGIDWKGDKVPFDITHFAYCIKTVKALPFDPTLPDSEALRKHLQHLKTYTRHTFKLKKPIWKFNYD